MAHLFDSPTLPCPNDIGIIDSLGTANDETKIAYAVFVIRFKASAQQSSNHCNAIGSKRHVFTSSFTSVLSCDP